MNEGPFTCLLLDVGKVLIDLNYQDLSERMLALTGLNALQLQAVLTQDGLVQKFETGNMNAPQFHAEVCRRIGVDLPWEEFLAAWNSILGRPLVAEEIIAAIVRNVRLWIISNTNELHFDFMTRHFAFPRYCEGFVLSHEVGALKPDARIFTRALDLIRAVPSEVLYADDNEANIKAAQKLGICAFQCRSACQLESELKLHGIL